ncbi:MAG: murein transglycosylase A [Methyloligellaceae bacterium]
MSAKLSMPPMLATASAQESKQAEKVIKQASLSPPNVMAYTKRKPNFRLSQVSFKELPGWSTDKHEEAFLAFTRSCKRIIAAQMRRASAKNVKSKQVYDACRIAAKFNSAPDRATAKKFFEKFFVPHKVNTSKKYGLLTGYYEPEILGSYQKTERFSQPVYRKPRNMSWPLPTREEIDKGALNGKGFELLYLEDAIDLFFLHIQGSGRIRLTDGSVIRIGFHSKNGHPYSSIGKYMIKKGYVPKAGMSLDAVKVYLRKNKHIQNEILWVNKSYIFFRKLKKRLVKMSGPLGAMQVPLTPGRSLAVDTRYHELGMPIYVVSASMNHHGANGFRRLMVAQDVGSAILGSERGDIFWGTGDKAGTIAGNTGNHGNYFVLLPKQS